MGFYIFMSLFMTFYLFYTLRPDIDDQDAFGNVNRDTAHFLKCLILGIIWPLYIAARVYVRFIK